MTLPAREDGLGKTGLSPEPAPAAIFPILAGYGLLIVALLIVVQWMSGTDYVGPDSDDNMRLVEVRDFLAGQGWFDIGSSRRFGFGCDARCFRGWFASGQRPGLGLGLSLDGCLFLDSRLGCTGR